MSELRGLSHESKTQALLSLPPRVLDSLNNIKWEIRAGRPIPVKCPAGEARQFKDTGGDYCYCKIEQQPVAVKGGAMGLAMYCCDEYGECPTWQADRDNDPAVRRQQEAIARRERDRETQRQIDVGMRVDDTAERESARIAEEVEADEERLSDEMDEVEAAVREGDLARLAELKKRQEGGRGRS